MKATFTQKGKKYIYKVDGKQIRTSLNAYEYVAIRLRDGEYIETLSCGKLSTCSKWLHDSEGTARICQARIDLMNGEIDYRTYRARVGTANAMAASYFRNIIQKGEKESYIEWQNSIIEKASHYEEIILKFEQE